MVKRRWQDWANVVLGGWFFVSPWVLGFGGVAAGNAWTFGLFMVISAVWALAQPDSRTPEAANIGFGAWVFFVPWMLGFSGVTMSQAWNAWLVGGTVALFAGWAIERISRAEPHHA